MKVKSIDREFEKLTFLADRTPETPPQDADKAFATLSDYRDGAIFIAHYAGNSEWERHPAGDELVMVVEGETTLFLLSGVSETSHLLRAGEFLVVPKSSWHRFESPKGVKVMTITPQPTEHSSERPDEAS